MSNEQREKVIEVLNKARSMELYAIIQYMHQHYIIDDLDYGVLASKVKKIAIDEMKHAEKFAERIKEINGLPVTDIVKKVTKNQDVKEVFEFNAAAEDDTIATYNEFIKVCRDNGDIVSARLFEEITEVEQEHYNYFDDTDQHIKTLKESFLAKMSVGSAG
ncbi:MAG: hypothetical protein LBQ54_04040 [Planctomycetaceae bacterium]|jgi:bacterioferritin|nr:hypothetical protein [Planctomycetaceae bacterium]